MRLLARLELPEFVARAPESAPGLVVLVLASLGGVAITSVAIRPLRPLFRLVGAPERACFVGKSCRIASGRVDADFGYADVNEDAAGLRVDVRCQPPNPLARGSLARLDSWDAKREVYWIRPVEEPANAEAGLVAGASGSEPR
jgi:hypothetical protein